MIVIRDWNIHFENAQSRRFERTHWVAMPNKRGYGYTKLLKSENGEALFGCWCAIVELASTCTPRGTLQSNGIPYSVSDITALILYSEQTINQMIDVCSKSLKWIDIVAVNTAVLPECECGITAVNQGGGVSLPSYPIHSDPSSSDRLIPEQQTTGKFHTVAVQLVEEFRIAKSRDPAYRMTDNAKMRATTAMEAMLEIDGYKPGYIKAESKRLHDAGKNITTVEMLRRAINERWAVDAD